MTLNPARLLAELGVGERRRLAEYRDLSFLDVDVLDMQRALARDESDSVRFALARNPILDPVVQMQMARGRQSRPKSYLLENPNLDVVVLEVLAKDRDSMVRSLLAIRRGLSTEMLLVLTKDTSTTVRDALAENIDAVTNPEVATILARDSNLTTRFLLASNPALAQAAVEVLLEDNSPEVLEPLGENPALELTLDLPVSVLQHSVRGTGYINTHLEGVDPGDRASLEPEWAGTLRELMGALRSFA